VHCESDDVVLMHCEELLGVSLGVHYYSESGSCERYFVVSSISEVASGIERPESVGILEFEVGIWRFCVVL